MDRPALAPAGGAPQPDGGGHPRVGGRDTVDADGKLTLRHASRLHHIGIGRRWSGTKVLILARDLELRIITQENGELVREFTLDPARDYQAQAPRM